MFYSPQGKVNYGFSNDNFINPLHLSNIFSKKIATPIPQLKTVSQTLDPFVTPLQTTTGAGNGDILNTNANPSSTNGGENGDDIATTGLAGNGDGDKQRLSFESINSETIQLIVDSLKQILDAMPLLPVPTFVPPNTNDANVNLEIGKLLPLHLDPSADSKGS